jgi:translocation and assembly module TamA
VFVTALCTLAATFPAWAQPTQEITLALQAGSGKASTVDVLLTERWLKSHAQLWQFLSKPELTQAELDDLIARAPLDIAQLLNTRGYFNSRVQLNQRNGQTDLTVELGPLTTIAAADVRVADEDGNELPELTQTMRDNWGLKPGSTFTQSAWQRAKDNALIALASSTYYQARVENSQADIDPTTQLAHLHVELTSGPAFIFGPITVVGASRYQATQAIQLAELAGLQTGNAYTAQTLFDAQRRIMDNGNYSAAFVNLSPMLASGLGQPARLSARIEVNEKPLQRLEASIGVSTDSGPRLHLTHTHYRPPLLEWQATHTLDWQRDAKTLSSNWLSPHNEAAWQWTGGLALAQQIDDDITTNTHNWRAGRTQSLNHVQRTYYAQLVQSKERVRNQAPTTTSALSGHWAWSRTRWDNPTDPGNGHALSFDVGTGVTLSQGAKPYLRAHTQWLGLTPFNNPKTGRLATRVALGGVIASEHTAVPSSDLFFTGGDTSVRGYALRSIGRSDGQANNQGLTMPGRLMWLGSLEWQRPTTWGGDVGRVEQTWFVDAGAVSNRLNEQRVYVGTGTGVRFLSPVGPMQLDMAYGHQTREWRLHLFVGIRF